MNNEPATTTETTELDLARQTAIAEQEAKFAETDSTLATCRAFWEKHKENLLKFTYSGFYGWYANIDFSTASHTAKEIAKAFGADGWKRHRDEYICGRINWKKELDGVT